jgi:hypothetical protein
MERCREDALKRRRSRRFKRGKVFLRADFEKLKDATKIWPYAEVPGV